MLWTPTLKEEPALLAALGESTSYRPLWRRAEWPDSVAFHPGDISPPESRDVVPQRKVRGFHQQRERLGEGPQQVSMDQPT